MDWIMLLMCPLPIMDGQGVEPHSTWYSGYLRAILVHQEQFRDKEDLVDVVIGDSTPFNWCSRASESGALECLL